MQARSDLGRRLREEAERFDREMESVRRSAEKGAQAVAEKRVSEAVERLESRIEATIRSELNEARRGMRAEWDEAVLRAETRLRDMERSAVSEVEHALDGTLQESLERLAEASGEHRAELSAAAAEGREALARAESEHLIHIRTEAQAAGPRLEEAAQDAMRGVEEEARGAESRFSDATRIAEEQAIDRIWKMAGAISRRLEREANLHARRQNLNRTTERLEAAEQRMRETDTLVERLAAEARGPSAPFAGRREHGNEGERLEWVE